MRPYIFVFVFLFSIGIMACSTTNTIQKNDISSADSSINVIKRTPSVSNKRLDRTDLSELFWMRQDSAKMQFTQPDVNFMTGMIGHHAQALIMSSMASVNNASPSIVILTKRIINAQKDEIGIMQRWLHERNQSVPQVIIEGLQLFIKAGNEPSLVFDSAQVAHAVKHFNKHGSYMDFTHYQLMHGNDMNHEGMDHSKMGHSEGEMNHENMDHADMQDHSGMPGMLTQDQLEELALAKGTEFDRLFLTYMIQHHTGAIIMVKDLVETDGAAQELQIGELAGEINVDQKTEIERMRLMLMEVVGLND
ncbi:MAG: DUF305 domain-containing protein [Balneola sp.]|nr:DUF305 domain-containing protein [Balneola sp.]